MKEIICTRGAVAFCDDEDFEFLTQFTWHLDSDGYARTNVNFGGTWKTKRMHKLLLPTVAGEVCDHVNAVRLDNRRANLRIADVMRNSWNRRPTKRGYKGVYPNKDKWVATIQAKGKMKSLGYYATPELAAAAYNRAAKELHGEFAYQNPLPA